MYNLIQIQEEIKNLPLRDVMDYANGKNPQVPPYIALGELNRRKQLEDTARASQAQPQGTVKQQVESSLTQGSQFANNPTVPPQIANPAQAPQMGAPTQAMRGANPAQAPQQVNPTQAMNPAILGAPKQMAEGGLATLPTQMFNSQNYAGGGIIAFDNGGEVPRFAGQTGSYIDPSLYTFGSTDTQGYTEDPELKRIREINEAEEKARAERKSWFRNSPLAALVGLPPPTKDKKAAETEDFSQFDEAARRFEEERQARLDKEKQGAPTPNNTTTAQGPKSGAPTNAGLPSVAPKKRGETTDADIEKEIEREKMIRQRMGVSEDPNAPIRERLAAIEEQRRQDREGTGMRGLINTLGTIGASKATNFFQAMGEGAQAGTKFDQEQMELRDRQDSAMADKQAAIIKEDEARKRNDAAAVQAAIKEQKEADIKWYNAESQRIAANKPTAVQEQENLYKRNPELFEKLYGRKDPMSQYRDDAIKTYLDPSKNFMLKKDFPTLDDYLKSLNLPPLSQSEKAGGTLPKGWTVTENKS